MIAYTFLCVTLISLHIVYILYISIKISLKYIGFNYNIVFTNFNYFLKY